MHSRNSDHIWQKTGRVLSIGVGQDVTNDLLLWGSVGKPVACVPQRAVCVIEGTKSFHHCFRGLKRDLCFLNFSSKFLRDRPQLLFKAPATITMPSDPQRNEPATYYLLSLISQ